MNASIRATMIFESLLFSITLSSDEEKERTRTAANPAFLERLCQGKLHELFPES